MILAELSEDRLRDENELCAMNPPRLDDATALVSAIIRRRVADLCLIARDPNAAQVQQFSQRGLALDCAAWLREAGATTADPEQVAPLLLAIVGEAVDPHFPSNLTFSYL